MRPCLKKIDALTGIRAYACLWVVLYHIMTYYSIREFSWGAFNPVIGVGFLGVDLFFILSGFIIAYVHQTDFFKIRAKDLFRFYGLRLARIFPVHYFMMLLYLLFLLSSFYLFKTDAGAAEHYTFESFLYNLLNIQAWGVSHTLTWNLPAWSISAEWFAYLLFPFVNMALWRIEKPSLNLLLLFGLLAGQYLMHWFMDRQGVLWTYDTGLLRIGFEFIIGYVVFNLFKTIPISEKQADRAALFVTLFFIAGLMLKKGNPFSFAAAFPFLLLFLSRAKGMFSALFSNKVACFLGEISFSIYMAHALCLVLFGKVWQALASQIIILNALPAPLILCIQLISIVTVSYLIYRWVELPSRNRIRRWLDKTPQAKSDPAEPLPQNVGLQPIPAIILPE